MRIRHTFGPGFVAALGCAVLLTGCNRDNANRSTTTANDTTAPAARPAATDNTVAKESPVTLTGCLQQGDSRSSYILTEMNEPSSRPTATSGSTASGDKVAREQLKEAQHAYRLDAKNDEDLSKLVGKRVRVSGTVTDKSDLVAGNDQNRDRTGVGTSGRTNDDRDRQKISESDLARVDVASVEKIGDACGSSASARKAPGKHRK